MLLEPAIISGISQRDFWDYTLAEIIIQIKAYNKQNEARTKQNMIMNYNLASMIVAFLGCSLNGKSIPKFEQLYPDLNQEEVEVQDVKQNDAYFLAQMIEFKYNHNKETRNG